MKKSYKSDAILGVKWTSLSSIIVASGSFLLIIVLTNILNKKDFGLYAIVSMVIGFSGEFVDMGISQAIIQKQKIKKQQLSTLYWMNVFLACLVFLVINLISNAIAVFYNEYELPELLLIVSFSFLFSGLSAQYQALLQKELKFKIMSILDIIGFVVYVSITLYLANTGFGVYSLVWGTLASAGLKSILLIITGLKYHKPTFYFNWKEIKYFLNFGSFRTGSFLLSFLNRQLDSILIGKVIGLEELGIYDVFKRVVRQPIRVFSPIVQKVVYPLLSKVNDIDARMSEMFVKVLRLLNIIRYPIYIGIVLLAREIVSLFFGEAWIQYVVVLQLLAIIYLFKTIQSFIGQAVMAKGKANWNFYNNLIVLPLNILSIWLGSYWGIIGISFSLLVLNLTLIIPRYYLIVKPLFKLTLRRYLFLILKGFVTLIMIGSIIFYVTNNFLNNQFYLILIKSFLFVLFYLGSLLCFDKDLIKYLKYIFK